MALLRDLLFITSLGLAVTSVAQTDSETTETQEPAPVVERDKKSLIRYSGVVQYSDGTSERIDASKTRTPLAFGATIYEDERLQIGQDATLKIVTRQECIAVFHGAAVAQASNREKPWRTKAEAVRWICPEGRSETFVAQNLRYKITSGEVLIEGSKVIVLKGELRAAKTPAEGFALRTVYQVANGTFTAAPGQDEGTNWRFHRSRKPPRESTPWTEPVREEAPPPPATSRFIFGPMGGNGMVGYDVTPLGQEELNGGGGRIQLHRRSGERGSLVGALTIRDLQDPTVKNSTLLAGKVTNDLSVFLLEGGWRSKHDSIFSPFFRAGGGLVYSRVNVNRQDIGYASENRYEFYVLSLAGGLDAIYCPTWLGSIGVYGGMEAQLMQSIGRGEKREYGQYSPTSYPEESREPWSLTTFVVNVMLGLVYQY